MHASCHRSQDVKDELEALVPAEVPWKHPEMYGKWKSDKYELVFPETFLRLLKGEYNLRPCSYNYVSRHKNGNVMMISIYLPLLYIDNTDSFASII